jgi:hypothetical protein
MNFLTVGNISISIIINSIRINLSWIGNMVPDTRIAKIKMLEDSIDSAKKEANQKYDQLITLLKEQGQKLDHTTDNHRAQIGDIKNMISGLTQQINKHLTKMSRPSRLTVPIKGDQLLIRYINPNIYFHCLRGNIYIGGCINATSILR